MTQNGFQSKPLILDMILDMIYRKFEGKVLGVPERSGLSVTIRYQVPDKILDEIAICCIRI